VFIFIIIIIVVVVVVVVSLSTQSGNFWIYPHIGKDVEGSSYDIF
jgi:hypothetical protein